MKLAGKRAQMYLPASADLRASPNLRTCFIYWLRVLAGWNLGGQPVETSLSVIRQEVVLTLYRSNMA